MPSSDLGTKHIFHGAHMCVKANTNTHNEKQTEKQETLIRKII